MFKLSAEENYEGGEIIFEEGSAGTQVYVILSGGVEISKKGKQRRIILNTLIEGEVLGELSYFGGYKRTASAMAVGETKLGVIDLKSADTEISNLSEDVRAIFKVMLERYKGMIDRASEATYRKDPRIHRTLFVTYQDSQSFMKASMIKASTGNLSVGGLFIQTKTPLKEGEQFLLELQLPNTVRSISVTCEVAWSRDKQDLAQGPPGMGVEFREMSEEDQKILTHYVNEEMLKEEE
jgi:uncharacterized protein (TIGR02266 family)